MTRRARTVLKSGVWAACLTPLALLLYRVWTDALGANPISFVTNTLGDWTFRILLASLGMTPLRLVFGFGWPATLRRLLGLFAFAYAGLHFGVWLVLDHFFDWRQMGADIVKRPYITVGMSALVLLVPLAATSTAGMVKRLGGARWRRLHRLVYGIGVLAALHFLWLAKVGRKEQYVYVAILTLLLGVRAWDWARRRVKKSREQRSHAVSLSGHPRPAPTPGRSVQRNRVAPMSGHPPSAPTPGPSVQRDRVAPMSGHPPSAPTPGPSLQ